MTVAIGCTGGKHRSVAMSEEIVDPAARRPGSRPRPPTATSAGSRRVRWSTEPSVVALGGGHGLAASLTALRSVTTDLTAVVTVADNGGSSGRLRDEFGVLPPGDLRMALAALCGDDRWGQTWARVLQHRFESEGEMDGHSMGNLLIVTLWDLLHDHVDGLDWVAGLLGARGRVLPMALTPLDITAEVRGAGDDPDEIATVRGQVEVATTPGEVLSVALEPERRRGLPAGGRGRSRRPTGSSSAPVPGTPASSRTCSCPIFATPCVVRRPRSSCR